MVFFFFSSLCHQFPTGPGILFSCFSCGLIKCVCLEVERPQRETGNGIPPKAKFRDTLNVIKLVAWFDVFLLAGDILLFITG